MIRLLDKKVAKRVIFECTSDGEWVREEEGVCLSMYGCVFVRVRVGVCVCKCV